MLKPEIVKYLSEQLGFSEGTIRKNISILKQKHSKCTSNAVAHLYAQQHGKSVMGKLTKEDKETLPHFEIDGSRIKLKGKQAKQIKKIPKFIKYESNNHFIKGHIDELNRAFDKKCFTSTYILARKIIENLIIDILKKKFPENNKPNKELYYDTNQRRYKDFSVILRNIYDKRTDFKISSSKAIQRLQQLTKNFKDDANEKTHCWYHLVKSPSEIKNLQLEEIFELIKTIENEEAN